MLCHTVFISTLVAFRIYIGRISAFKQAPLDVSIHRVVGNISTTMNCQKCRTPLKLDNSLQDLNPAAFDLLVGQ